MAVHPRSHDDRLDTLLAHAPFAAGRAFLTERGHGDCKVLVHQQRQQRGVTGSKEQHLQKKQERSTSGGGKEEQAQQTARKNGFNDDDDEKLDESKFDLRLLEIGANDLAPAPPDTFGGKTTKNHSQSQASSGVGLE